MTFTGAEEKFNAQTVCDAAIPQPPPHSAPKPLFVLTHSDVFELPCSAKFHFADVLQMQFVSAALSGLLLLPPLTSGGADALMTGWSSVLIALFSCVFTLSNKKRTNNKK